MDRYHLAGLPRAFCDLRQSTALPELRFLLWARTVMPSRWEPARAPSFDPCLASRYWGAQRVLLDDRDGSLSDAQTMLGWKQENAEVHYYYGEAMEKQRQLQCNRKRPWFGVCDGTVSSVCCEALGWVTNLLRLFPFNIRNTIKNNSLGDCHEYLMIIIIIWDFPGVSNGKKICLQCGRPRFDPWVGKIPLRRKWQPTPVFLPGKSHGQRSLASSTGSQRVGHDWAANTHTHTIVFIKWL